MKALPDCNKSVLVIDDEYMILQTLREALELNGYQVITAQNGRDGLRVLENRPLPSIILLDLLMPIMGGRDFLQRVATDFTLANIPIVVVSASLDDTKMLGATLCIRKPPDLDLLLDMIELHTTSKEAHC